MSDVILEVDKVSKQYRLGQVGTGTLSHDLNRQWHRIRGKEDPYLKVGQLNDRAQKGGAGIDYVWALRDIEFLVCQGDAVGIIGNNGAGKSTLLKVLSRITAPTVGRISYNGRIASLLEVGTGFHPELTGRENIYLNGTILGMRKEEVDRKLDEIVEFSGVAKYLDTPSKRYSSGMTVRLGFAVAAHLEPEILIVDEVLAVGDADFQDKCIRKMQSIREDGRTILFVSHNMSSINRLCNRGILLKDGMVDFMDDSIEKVTSRYLNVDVNNLNLHSIENREGAGNLQLRAISVKNSIGEEVVAIQSGDSIELVLDISSFYDHIIEDDFEIRVLFRNRDDFVLGLLHSRTSSEPLRMQHGLNKISVRVPKFPLVNDILFIDVAVRYKNILEDRCRRVFKLNVTEGGFFSNNNFAHPKFFRGALIDHQWGFTNI